MASRYINISNRQGNANQNHNEISTPVRTAITKELTRAGEDVQKREFSYTVGGNENWYNHYGKQYRGSSKNQKQNYQISQGNEILQRS